jgi:hypothetical protein
MACGNDCGKNCSKHCRPTHTLTLNKIYPLTRNGINDTTWFKLNANAVLFDKWESKYFSEKNYINLHIYLTIEEQLYDMENEAKSKIFRSDFANRFYNLKETYFILLSNSKKFKEQLKAYEKLKFMQMNKHFYLGASIYNNWYSITDKVLFDSRDWYPEIVKTLANIKGLNNR